MLPTNTYLDSTHNYNNLTNTPTQNSHSIIAPHQAIELQSIYTSIQDKQFLNSNVIPPVTNLYPLHSQVQTPTIVINTPTNIMEIQYNFKGSPISKFALTQYPLEFIVDKKETLSKINTNDGTQLIFKNVQDLIISPCHPPFLTSKSNNQEIYIPESSLLSKVNTPVFNTPNDESNSTEYHTITPTYSNYSLIPYSPTFFNKTHYSTASNKSNNEDEELFHTFRRNTKWLNAPIKIVQGYSAEESSVNAMKEAICPTKKLKSKISNSRLVVKKKKSETNPRGKDGPPNLPIKTSNENKILNNSLSIRKGCSTMHTTELTPIPDILDEITYRPEPEKNSICATQKGNSPNRSEFTTIPQKLEFPMRTVNYKDKEEKGACYYNPIPSQAYEQLTTGNSWCFNTSEEDKDGISSMRNGNGVVDVELKMGHDARCIEVMESAIDKDVGTKCASTSENSFSKVKFPRNNNFPNMELATYIDQTTPVLDCETDVLPFLKWETHVQTDKNKKVKSAVKRDRKPPRIDELRRIIANFKKLNPNITTNTAKRKSEGHINTDNDKLRSDPECDVDTPAQNIESDIHPKLIEKRTANQKNTKINKTPADHGCELPTFLNNPTESNSNANVRKLDSATSFSAQLQSDVENTNRRWADINVDISNVSNGTEINGDKYELRKTNGNENVTRKSMKIRRDNNNKLEKMGGGLIENKLQTKKGNPVKHTNTITDCINRANKTVENTKNKTQDSAIKMRMDENKTKQSKNVYSPKKTTVPGNNTKTKSESKSKHVEDKIKDKGSGENPITQQNRSNKGKLRKKDVKYPELLVTLSSDEEHESEEALEGTTTDIIEDDVEEIMINNDKKNKKKPLKGTDGRLKKNRGGSRTRRAIPPVPEKVVKMTDVNNTIRKTEKEKTTERRNEIVEDWKKRSRETFELLLCEVESMQINKRARTFKIPNTKVKPLLLKALNQLIEEKVTEKLELRKINNLIYCGQLTYARMTSKKSNVNNMTEHVIDNIESEVIGKEKELKSLNKIIRKEKLCPEEKALLKKIDELERNQKSEMREMLKEEIHELGKKIESLRNRRQYVTSNRKFELSRAAFYRDIRKKNGKGVVADGFVNPKKFSASGKSYTKREI